MAIAMAIAMAMVRLRFQGKGKVGFPGLGFEVRVEVRLGWCCWQALRRPSAPHHIMLHISISQSDDEEGGGMRNSRGDRHSMDMSESGSPKKG